MKLLANGSVGLFVCAAFVATPALPQVVTTASSPDERWFAIKAGACIAILPIGNQILMSHLRDRKVSWDGGCDASGLADGEGLLTLTARFVENGTSYPFKTEQRITFRNGLLDGTGTRTGYDRPPHPDGKPGQANAPWQAKKPSRVIYRSGCEYWALYTGEKQAYFCQPEKGVAFRDTVRMTATTKAPPTPSADLTALRQRAEKGDAAARYDMAMRYWNGDGVTKSITDYLFWLRKAGERSHPAATNLLGVVYSDGLHGTPQDRTEGVRWYRLSADKGNAVAQANLAYALMTGRGVAQDNAEAFRYAQLAAQQGHSSGQRLLGILYRNGRGVPEDHAEATRWFKLGAEGGDLEAQQLYASHLLMGWGVAKNRSEAARWFRTAADRGDSQSQFLFGLMAYSGNGVPRDQQLGLRMIQAARDQGHSDAAAHLAKIAQDERNAAAERQRLEQQRQQQQQAAQARARQQAADRQASGRLAAGALTALLGGNARQVQQALTGQTVTNDPPRRAVTPTPRSPAGAPLAQPSNRTLGPWGVPYAQSMTPVPFAGMPGCINARYLRHSTWTHYFEVSSSCPTEVHYMVGPPGTTRPDGKTFGGIIRPGERRSITHTEYVGKGEPLTVTKVTLFACPGEEWASRSLGFSVRSVGYNWPSAACLATPHNPQGSGN